MNNGISISSSEYNHLKNLIYDRFGIDLGDKKQALITGRLQKILKQYKYNSFEEFYNYVLNDKSGDGMDILINRISTNHTYFNRENIHFDFFHNDVLPWAKELSAGVGGKTIRVWSAGCSSGEEAYTLAIFMDKYYSALPESYKYAVLATDISNRVLQIAKSGIYQHENIHKLPGAIIQKYFDKGQNDQYRVVENVKKNVLFRRLNLMRETYPFNNKFHVIFCRNVMIYFDAVTRERLIERFSQYLLPGGYLFLGLSESLGRQNPFFEYIQPSVYRKS